MSQRYDDATQPLPSRPSSATGRRPKRRRRTAAGCLVPLVVLGALGGAGYYGYTQVMNHLAANTCVVTAEGRSDRWTAAQTANAATIVTVGVGVEGMITRAAQVATTTAIQESKLRNLTTGDLDSIGLFQQRPSQGWGTRAQILDPVYSSSAFYRALAKISGWQTMAVNDAAQAVQRSGYPSAYAAHEAQGGALAAVFSGTVHEGVGCRLDPATSSSTAAEVVAKLKAQSGWTSIAADSHTVNANPSTTNRAWAIASWAVAHAQDIGAVRVTVGDREWSRQAGSGGWSWHDATRPTSGSAAVRIELYAG